jgi:hypothetical protein
MDDIFTPTTPSIDPEKDYFAEYVGEGKKYKTPQDAGRAIVEKDAFIARVLEEKRQLEEDLRTRSNEQNFLDQLKSVVKPPLTPDVGTPPPQSDPSPTVDPKNIEALVQKTIEAQREREERTRNLNEVKQALTNVFGADYANSLKQRANELGIPVEWLNDAAAKSPKAFYRMLGLDAAPARSDLFTPPTTVNTAGFNQDKTVKNWAYYNDLRKTDPTKYHSPATQKELWENAKKLGEKFTT